MSDIFALSDEAVDRLVEIDPITATFAGVPGHNHRWPDLSPQGVAAHRALWAELAQRAEACPVDNDQDRLARRVLLEEASIHLRSIDRGDHHYDLNHITSPVQAVREVFDLQPSDTEADWEAVIARLSTADQPWSGYRRTLDEGRSLGRVVARRQVDAAIEQAETMAGDNSPFRRLTERLAASAAADAGLEGRLAEAIDHARSAAADLAEYLRTTYRPDAAADDPVGRERYVAAAEKFLGRTIDVEATYRWGWDEVERLSARAGELCHQIAPGRSFAEVVEMLNSDPAYGAPTAEAFIEVMRERQEHALEQLSGVHFDVPEQIRTIEVKMAPPGGAAGAYYSQPAEDFSRAGTVWYSPTGRDRFPLFGEVTTAYHEGFPGHHLQVGSQMVMAERLSRFHRLLVWYPGSGEGWALYAEHLMGELGYLERPEYELGLVLSQLFRACRVAIDIGSHCRLPIPDDVSFHPGESWTFDLAVELLQTRCAEPEATIHSEVTRYLGWPGQAIAYKVGEKAILDLRAELEARPGFEAKAFHSELLSIGSLGLDLINELMLQPAS